MSWIIREADENDAELLFGYLLEVSGASREMLPVLVEAERDYIRHFADTANSVLLLAVDADRVIGTASVSGAPGVADVWLTISVHPAYHGYALGLDLMRTAINWARLQSSIWRVRMHIDATSPGTLRLFEHLGFNADGPGQVSYTCYGTTLVFRAVGMFDDLHRAS